MTYTKDSFLPPFDESLPRSVTPSNENPLCKNADLGQPEETADTAPLPPLHIVTVATHVDGCLTSLLYSSLLLKADMSVLCWGEKWKGFGMKEVELVRECKKLPPNDVIMVIDGFDTVLLQPKEVITRKFLEFGGRVVLAGEAPMKVPVLSKLFLAFHNCIFKSDASKQWPKLLPYANKQLGLQLINAGSMIGYVGDFLRLFNGFEYSWNDQRFLTERFLENPHVEITFDANCSIFCLYRTRRQHRFLSFEEAEKQARHVVPFLPGEDKETIARRYRQPAPSFQRTALKGVVMDAITHEIPCVLHMYCRQNANWLLRKLGLPVTHSAFDVLSILWYIIFSLRGTILESRAHGKSGIQAQWVISLLSMIMTCLGLLGVFLNFLAYLTTLPSAAALAHTLRLNFIAPLRAALAATLLHPATPTAAVQKVPAPAALAGPPPDARPGPVPDAPLYLQQLTDYSLTRVPAVTSVAVLLIVGETLVYAVQALLALAVWLWPLFVTALLVGAPVLLYFVWKHGGLDNENETLTAHVGETTSIAKVNKGDEKLEAAASETEGLEDADDNVMKDSSCQNDVSTTTDSSTRVSSSEKDVADACVKDSFFPKKISFGRRAMTECYGE